MQKMGNNIGKDEHCLKRGARGWGKIWTALIAAAALLGTTLSVSAATLHILGTAPDSKNLQEDCEILLISDNKTGAVLTEKNAGEKTTLIGGTVRWMVALTAVDHLELSEEVTLEAADLEPFQGNRKIGLRAGQTLTVRDLLAAMMVDCAQDAAVALANKAAQKAGADDFVALMNEKAAELGMKDTTFKNATGALDSGQVTTANDQLLLARALYANEDLSEILSLSSYTMESDNRNLPSSIRNFLTIMDPQEDDYNSLIQAASRGSGSETTYIAARAKNDQNDLTILFWAGSTSVSASYSLLEDFCSQYMGIQMLDVSGQVEELAAGVTATVSGKEVSGWTPIVKSITAAAYPGFELDTAQLRLTADAESVKEENGTATMTARLTYGETEIGSVVLQAVSQEASAQTSPAAPPQSPAESQPASETEQGSGGNGGAGWILITLAAAVVAGAVIVLGKFLQKKIK